MIEMNIVVTKNDEFEYRKKSVTLATIGFSEQSGFPREDWKTKLPSTKHEKVENFSIGRDW